MTKAAKSKQIARELRRYKVESLPETQEEYKEKHVTLVQVQTIE